MIKVLFAGEGGQGVQVIAEILAKAAFNECQFASCIPNFGVEQRGGISLAFVAIDNQPIVYPKFEKADILAILSDRSFERVKPYLNSETEVILSPAVTQKKIPKVSRAIHLRGGPDRPPRAWNILVLGKVNRKGKIVSQASLIKAMDERFARQFKKNPELKELDLRALKEGSLKG